MNLSLHWPSLRPGAILLSLGCLVVFVLEVLGHGLPLHFLLELACVALALACSLLLLKGAQATPGQQGRFWGLGLGLIGLTDALHILFSPHFGISHDLSPGWGMATWLGSRYLLVGMLLVRPWLLRGRVSPETARNALALVGLPGLALLFALAPALPQGPTLADPLAWGLLLLFGAAGLVNGIKQAEPQPLGLHFILGSLVFSLASAAIPLLQGPKNLEALFQLMAYYCLYQVLAGPLELQARTAPGAAATQASHSDLSLVLNELPELIILMDASGVYTDILGNRSFLLHSPSEMLGRNFRELLPPAIADTLAGDIARSRQSGQPVIREVDLAHEGKRAVFESRLSILPDGRILLQNRDNTQEKAAHQAQAQSESKLASVMAMMPDLVLVLDEAGYYRDFLGNLDLLMEAPEAKLNQNYRDFLPLELAEAYEANVQKSRQTGQAVSAEIKLPVPQGVIEAESRVLAGKDGLVLVLLRDISERKEAEQALAQSQAQLQSIVSMLPDLLVVVDEQGYYRALLGNQSLRTVEEVGKHYKELLPESVATQYEAHLAESRSTGAMAMREGKMPIQGELKDVEVRLRVAESGFALILIRDISERKQAESALAQSQARLASALAMMPDLLMVVDDKGYYRDFLGNLDLKTLEQVGKHYREVLPPPFADQYERHLEESRSTGKTVRNEFPLTVRGEIRQIEARVQTNAERWVLVLLRDITERKQAEWALADSQRRLQGVVQMLPDMVFVLDDQGVYRSVMGNQEYLVLPPDSLIGKAARETLPPALAQQVMDNIHTVLTTGHPVEFEYDLLLGGQTAWFEGRMVKLEDKLTLSLIRNITARKQAERSILEAKEAAERANLAKSNFLATMNHELRTPMNGVLGMAQLLAESPLNDLQREFVDTILTSGEALVSLLSDIMDLTRIETNRIQFKPVETNLGQVLDMVVRLFRGSANAKGLDLSVKLDRAVQPWVLADSTLLKQVLSNLVANAIKFSEQGSILVSATLVQPQEADQRVRFLVKDTGIGIAPDQQPLIFSAFYQVDDSSTRMQGGSGLGLSIVAALVRAMGSEIKVESALGQGSSFWFELDLPFSQRAWETVQPPQPVALPIAGLARKRPHVLIVEDDPNNRLVAQHFLHRANLSYDYAVNGKAALEAALEHDYDLILMDCRMPIMDGFEATRRLRQMERFAKTPIVALTAKTSEEDRKKCLEAGMDDFISKPVRFEVLREALARFLGQGLFQA